MLYFSIVLLACFALWACDPDAMQQKANTQDPSSDANTTTEEAQTTPPPENPGTTTGTIVSQEQEPLPGAYAVLYGGFGTEQEAEDNSRDLRAQRVNCYLHKTPDKKFGVLIGPFRNYSQAKKQMSRLQERGIESLSLYHLGETQ
jgi:cell division septation protein DedD